jgi:hypothetical protein
MSSKSRGVCHVPPLDPQRQVPAVLQCYSFVYGCGAIKASNGLTNRLAMIPPSVGDAEAKINLICAFHGWHLPAFPIAAIVGGT